nr:endoplasmic reticulum metallopeptidase 1-like [Halyomorpha halys]
MALSSLMTFFIITVCYNLFIAFAIDLFGYSLSWYTNIGVLVLIYIIPSIFMMVINTIVVDKWIMGNIAFNAKIQLSCLSIQLLWTLFLFASIFLNVRSSFILMVIVLPCALWTLITAFGIRGNRKLWHALFILISSFSSAMICYYGITSLRLFIPITGRMGITKNPEFIISLLTSLLSVAAFSYVATLFVHVKKQWVVLKIMFALHLMSFLIVISPFGFPFSFETPQRIFVTHVNRQFFNSQLSTEYSDSLFWIQSMERRGWNLIPFLRKAQRLDDFCAKNGYCGLPWFSKVRESIGSTCIPSASHNVNDETKLEIISKELIGKEFHLEFKISGSDHMGLIITPLENVTLLGWNLPSQVTQTSNVVSFVQGLHNSSQTILLEASKNTPDSRIKVEVYSLYFHHDKHYSSDFHNFLKKFPKWSHISPALAVYKSYVF